MEHTHLIILNDEIKRKKKVKRLKPIKHIIDIR